MHNMQRQYCAALALALYLIHVVAAQQAAPGQAELLAAELKQLRQQAKQHPDDPAVQATLAFKLQMLNTLKPDGGKTLRRAERAYRKALRLVGDAPGVHPIKANLAILLMHLDSAQEAVQLLDECLTVGELTPADRGAYLFNRGKALTILGRLAEADASYLAATKEAYGVTLGSYGKAVTALRELPQEVVQQLEEVSHAVRSNYVRDGIGVPSNAWLASHQQLSQQRRKGLAGILRLLKGSSDAGDASKAWLAGAPPADASWLHFALYQHHKKHKQYATAWHYLTIANALQAPSAGYTPEQDWFTVKTLVQSFKGDFPNSGLKDSSSVFVVGMPRSGSTLVEQMLGSHTQVFAAGEDTAMAPLTPAITQVIMSQPADLKQQLGRLGRQYLTSMKARIPAADADQVKYTVDKMLRNLWLLGYIQLILPHSCVVHVLRHPMDVALSCYAQPFGYSGTSWSWDLDHIVQQIQMTWQLADHWDEAFPGRLHVVLYEELVQNPEPVMRRLLQRCGLEWQESVLAPHNLTRHVHTASSTQVRKPLYLTSIGQWQRFKAQMEPARNQLEPLIRRYEQKLAQALAAYQDTQDTDVKQAVQGGASSGSTTPPGAQEEL